MNTAASIIVAVLATTFSVGAQAPLAKRGTNGNTTVLLDDYFNHETKKDESGLPIVWHYKWNETDNGGYSAWAGILKKFGARTETLSAEPTPGNLGRQISI